MSSNILSLTPTPYSLTSPGSPPPISEWCNPISSSSGVTKSEPLLAYILSMLFLCYSGGIDHKAYKAKHIYHPVLYRKSLPTAVVVAQAKKIHSCLYSFVCLIIFISSVSTSYWSYHQDPVYPDYTHGSSPLLALPWVMPPSFCYLNYWKRLLAQRMFHTHKALIYKLMKAWIK